MTRSKRNLGRMLLRSVKQAVAIESGKLKPARRHLRSVVETTVTPPPQYRSLRIRRLRENLGLTQPVFASALHHTSAAHACLQAADYCTWALHKKWRDAELRPWNAIKPFVKSDFDIFAGGTDYFYAR